MPGAPSCSVTPSCHPRCSRNRGPAPRPPSFSTSTRPDCGPPPTGSWTPASALDPKRLSDRDPSLWKGTCPMTDSLLVDRTDAVTTLTLNRPDSLNSLDTALKVALLEAVREAAADPQCRAVLITGAGRAFCVGQDLKEHMAALAGSDTPLDTVVEHYNPLVRALASLPKPVVAAVNGMAAGAGASLALLADFRVGGPSTALLMAFANVGLAGDTGAAWTLPRLVGHAKATEMLMLAEPVAAPELERLGLLTRLVGDDAEVLPAARELAARLAAGPTVAYGQIKRELLTGASGTLDETLAVEAEAQRLCGATADHRHATEAFVAKKKPQFTGA